MKEIICFMIFQMLFFSGARKVLAYDYMGASGSGVVTEIYTGPGSPVPFVTFSGTLDGCWENRGFHLGDPSAEPNSQTNRMLALAIISQTTGRNIAFYYYNGGAEGWTKCFASIAVLQ